MSLTVGTAPFGHRPGGTFNFAVPHIVGLIHVEDPPRRIWAKDHLALFNERVDVVIDRELQERPVTQWSRKRVPPS